MSTNQREIFQATVEHRRHDGFLYYAAFTPDLDRRIREAEGLGPDGDLWAHFGMWARPNVSLRPPADEAAPDFSAYHRDLRLPEGAFINKLGVLEVPGPLYHFTEYVSPLRNAETMADLEGFPYPDLAAWTEDHMAGEVREIHNRGLVAAGVVGHIYEDSWQIRGYEEFLIDMMDRPHWCEYILDRIKERNLLLACAAVRAGVDLLITGDDVANQRSLMFSKENWRRFMKCRWQEVYSAARALNPRLQIWYHSDGNIAEIIPELIEIGVTFLNPVQPECMDLVQLKKDFGDRLVFDGTIGTQSTMPFGTPGDVRAVVRERVATLGGDGGLILSPTHVLEPEVPIENIRAFFEAATEAR